MFVNWKPFALFNRRIWSWLIFGWRKTIPPPQKIPCLETEGGTSRSQLLRLSHSGAKWEFALYPSAWVRIHTSVVTTRLLFYSLKEIAKRISHQYGWAWRFRLTSTLTIYLTPNTRLSTPKLRYCVPKINTLQLSSFTELYCHCSYPIKCLAATSVLEYVDTHSLPTGYLRPCELDTTVDRTQVALAWSEQCLSNLLVNSKHCGQQNPSSCVLFCVLILTFGFSEGIPDILLSFELLCTLPVWPRNWESTIDGPQLKIDLPEFTIPWSVNSLFLLSWMAIRNNAIVA